MEVHLGVPVSPHLREDNSGLLLAPDSSHEPVVGPGDHLRLVSYDFLHGPALSEAFRSQRELEHACEVFIPLEFGRVLLRPAADPASVARHGHGHRYE